MRAARLLDIGAGISPTTLPVGPTVTSASRAATRAGRDVEHAHAGLKPPRRNAWRRWRTRAEGERALDEIVVARGAVEEPVDETAPVALVGQYWGTTGSVRARRFRVSLG
jgi:hypothetical protein